METTRGGGKEKGKRKDEMTEQSREWYRRRVSVDVGRNRLLSCRANPLI